MSPLASAQSLARRLGPPGLAAAAVALAALVVLLFSARGIASALTTPSAQLVEKAENEKKANAEKFKASFTGYLAQLDGRSLFFIPGPPAPPPPPPVVADKEEPKAPPPPATYGGPALTAMVNNTAWFADGKKLAEGQGDSELKLVEARPPWGALVEWKGVQFTINLFERDSVVFPAPKPVPAPAPATSEALMGPPEPAEAHADESKPPETGPPAPSGGGDLAPAQSETP